MFEKTCDLNWQIIKHVSKGESRLADECIWLPSLTGMIKKEVAQRQFIRPDYEINIKDGAWCMLELNMLIGEEKYADRQHLGKDEESKKETPREIKLFESEAGPFCCIWHTQADLYVSKANIYTNGATLEETLEYFEHEQVHPYVWQKLVIHPTKAPTFEEKEIVQKLLVLGYIVGDPVPLSEYGSLPLSPTARKMLEQQQ